VVVSAYRPGRGGEGTQLRHHAIVHGLRRRMPTDVLSVSDLAAASGHPRACPAPEPLPIEFGRADADDATAGTVRRPPFAGLYCARAARDLETLLRRARYRLVVLSDPMLYAYLPTLRAGICEGDKGGAGAGRLVVDLHNAEAELYREMVAHPVWPQAGHLPDPEGRLAPAIDRLERTMVHAADLVTVPSEPDRQRLWRRYGGHLPIAVLPNAVPMQDCRRPALAGPPQAAVFIGALRYFPNVLAALEIADSIGPAIRAAVPQLRLVVAGRYPPPLVADALRDSGVDLVADPQEVRPLYDRSILLVPLRLGGGTRLKILEAFGYGAPVVSTAKGIEGIDAENRVHYLGASTATEFAQAVLETVQDPVADLRRRRRAWELARSRYSWTALDMPIGEMLTTLAVPEPAGRPT
jgi:glycosyltransferase involved in cell wall biosynthesis